MDACSRLGLRIVWLLASVLVAGIAGGCALARPNKVALPAKHSLRSDQLLVLSDFKLGTEHPLIRDLTKMRRDVSESLKLPMGSKQVMVYLFSNELEYRQYWQATFPGFPMRRAYFVQSPGRELAVYTFWGERIQEDLRHEFTHGLLHAALESVPLWLDEGLAEYFEVAGPAPGSVNRDYVTKLATAVQNGWRPDLERLEQLEKVEQMQRTDYREAWAWVHYMLHDSPDAKQVLLTYLQELRRDATPGSLSDRLRAEVPEVDVRLLSYVGSLGTPGGARVDVRAQQ